MKIDNIDYGPLTALIGTWEGADGKDVSPEPDDTERNSYRERLVFTPVGSVTNAEEQVLVALHYRQEIHRNTNGKPLHEQTGYWIWDAESKRVIQTLTIPRGLAVVAEGSYILEDGGAELKVSASQDKGITQSPFLTNKALTKNYQHTTKITGDTLSYSQTTLLDIYGKEFKHTDEHELARVKIY